MKRFFLFFVLFSCALFSCVKSEFAGDPNAENATKWTVEQRESIDSIRPVEGSDGHIFEMNYTADYKLDECIKAVDGDLQNSISNIYSVLLPDSKVLISKPPSTQGVNCSCFSSASSDGEYVLGRNYDYPSGSNYYVVLHTNPKNGYKSVAMADVSVLLEKTSSENPFSTVRNKEAALFFPTATFDGINEKGLMCSFMQLEFEETHQNTGKQKLVSSWILRLLLDKCATVDEAIELIKNYDFQSVFSGYDQDLHYMIADASGKRVVVEHVADELKVLNSQDIFGKDVPYIVSTNFYLTPGRRVAPKEGIARKELGFWRWNKLQEDLIKNPTPSKDEAMKYMQDVRIVFNDQDEIADIQKKGNDPTDINSWTWMTLWSSVYNTKDLGLDVCIRENYDKKFSFGIDAK